jgi:hypothetical protein
VAESEPELVRRCVLELGDDADERAGDELSGLGVNLRAVQAADVISLEDLGRDRARRPILLAIPG